MSGRDKSLGALLVFSLFVSTEAFVEESVPEGVLGRCGEVDLHGFGAQKASGVVFVCFCIGF